jgi:hypothetical protein
LARTAGIGGDRQPDGIGLGAGGDEAPTLAEAHPSLLSDSSSESSGSAVWSVMRVCSLKIAAARLRSSAPRSGVEAHEEDRPAVDEARLVPTRAATQHDGPPSVIAVDGQKGIRSTITR